MKNRIIIWGTGDVGLRLMEKIDQEKNQIIAFVDNAKEKQGKQICSIPVLAYEDILDMENLQSIFILITAISSKHIFEILQQLDGNEIRNIGIVKSRILVKEAVIEVNIQNDMGEIVWTRVQGENCVIIPRLEINIVDNCNLKCVGCTHFASLYPDNSIYPMDTYERDLRQMRKVGKMVRLRLLGGEPLLAENLGEYIIVARKLFPEASIEVVTNGLLIPTKDKSLWKIFRDEDILLIISLYKPTVSLAEQIKATLDEQKVLWKYDGVEITEFSKNITLDKSHDGKKACNNCISESCTFLRAGNLYKCPVEALVFQFERYYKKDLGIRKRGVDIYDKNVDLKECVKQLALEPVETCQICSEKPESIPWQVNGQPRIEDWICI